MRARPNIEAGSTTDFVLNDTRHRPIMHLAEGRLAREEAACHRGHPLNFWQNLVTILMRRSSGDECRAASVFWGPREAICRRKLSEDAWRIDRRNKKLRKPPPTNSGRKTERFRRVADAPLALAALARRVCLDLLAVRAQDRGPGSLLPMVLRAGPGRQYQEHHDPGRRNSGRAAPGAGLRESGDANQAEGQEIHHDATDREESHAIVQNIIQHEREENADGRRSPGTRNRPTKRKPKTSSRSIPSPPTRPVVWPGSCSSCRRSWSSSSSI